MPVVNANSPTDQATLAALYQDKTDWYLAHQINELPKRAARLAAIEAIGEEQGYAYRTKIATRVKKLFADRKAKNKSLLNASSAKLQAFECLNEVSV